VTIQPRLNDFNGLVTIPMERVRIMLMAVRNRLVSMRASVTDARPHRFGMFVFVALGEVKPDSPADRQGGDHLNDRDRRGPCPRAASQR